MTDQTNESSPKRVLIVEDDPDLCMLIERLAQELPIELEICFARSVHEATFHLESSEPFDLILADFMLADSRSGYELRQLCEERAPGSSFAMMSSMPLQLPEIGEKSFLQKPFTLGECRQFLQAQITN